MGLMILYTVLEEAWRALRRHKLRSALSVLGICIGIAAVVCTVAIGNAGAIAIEQQLQNLGNNLVWIEAGGRTREGVRVGTHQTKTLIMEDVHAILREIPLLRSASPQVDGRVQVVYGDKNWYTTVRGITPEYFEIRHWFFAQGSAFDKQAVELTDNVCVIGSTVAERVFGGENPVGKMMRVRHLLCEVAGVLAEKGQSPTGADYDDQIFMPYTTVQRKIMGVTWLDDIMCSAVSTELIALAEEQVVALLRQRHHIVPGEQDDFNIRHPEDIVKAQASATQTYMSFMGSVAAISLLVGCIGIMNIMLVSTTERTREIGIRMAIGASERIIQLQFLSEAVLLSVLGGMSGILAGVLSSILLGRFTEWHTHVSVQAIGIASMLSIGIGILAGYYPARKAARLDPILAMRRE